MKRDIKFLVAAIIVPFIGSIPLGIVASEIFEKPLNVAIGQQFYYLAGIIAGVWIWGKGA